MFGISKLIFGKELTEPLSESQGAMRMAWLALPSPALDEPHFHTRYVILDVKQDKAGALAGVAALGVSEGGRLYPQDALWLDFSVEALAVNDALLAFLEFVGKAPCLCYNGTFVLPPLQKMIKQRLEVDFEPVQIDLAWLLPSLFTEKSAVPIPLDHWLQHFQMGQDGWRDPIANTLVIARLFQRLLLRAASKSLLTAGDLVAETRASDFLRRTH